METVTYTPANELGVAHIELNRPKVRNAVNDQLLLDLRSAMIEFDEDENARAGVLSGTGKAFSSGADLRESHLRPVEEVSKVGGPSSRQTKNKASLFFESTNAKPLIAAVHGYVLGTAIRLALTCDYVVAESGTQFQLTEVAIGLDVTGLWFLLNARGGGVFADDVSLTGRYWSAEEGLNHGIINEVSERGEYFERAMLVAGQIAALPSDAVQAVVRVRRQVLAESHVKAQGLAPKGLHKSGIYRTEAEKFFASKKGSNQSDAS